MNDFNKASEGCPGRSQLFAIFPACSTLTWTTAVYVAFGINIANPLELAVLSRESASQDVLLAFGSRDCWYLKF
jgi:hypothetical protein